MTKIFMVCGKLSLHNMLNNQAEIMIGFGVDIATAIKDWDSYDEECLVDDAEDEVGGEFVKEENMLVFECTPVAVTKKKVTKTITTEEYVVDNNPPVKKAPKVINKKV